MTRSRAEEYLALAESYAEAAKRLAPLPADICRPFDMLVAHSLELSFKAVLSRQGTSEEFLILAGHGLERCQRFAERDGFASDKVRPLVDVLDGPHGAQSLRYPSYIYRAPYLDAEGACATLAEHLASVAGYIREGVS